MKFPELIRAIKSEYGMNQTTLARQIGVSPQILTDIKAGRRRFTPAMAESIMALFAHEGGAGWLAETLQDIVIQSATAGMRRSSDIGTMTSGEVPVSGIRLPVLGALCWGDPQALVTNPERTTLIPEALVPLIGEKYFSYVLALDYDDFAGRLRAGDQLLIVQDVRVIKEIMVVACRGRLRLARNASCVNDGAEADIADIKKHWLALDTGKMLEVDSFVGVAMGIVVAML